MNQAPLGSVGQALPSNFFYFCNWLANSAESAKIRKHPSLVHFRGSYALSLVRQIGSWVMKQLQSGGAPQISTGSPLAIKLTKKIKPTFLAINRTSKCEKSFWKLQYFAGTLGLTCNHSGTLTLTCMLQVTLLSPTFIPLYIMQLQANLNTVFHTIRAIFISGKYRSSWTLHKTVMHWINYNIYTCTFYSNHVSPSFTPVSNPTQEAQR